MKSRYQEEEAERFVESHSDLPENFALRIYTSRLLGREPGLVLHGGGNTSVKLTTRNVVGEELDVLYVKGSGGDLAVIEPGGFAGLELDELNKLQGLEDLPDDEMENQLLIHRLRADAPAPSVDTLAHAFLPHRFVDHTHADIILALTNQDEAEERLLEALGDRAGIIPYAHPGFPLARNLFRFYRTHPDVEAIVILGHGIFTFGPDARTAYENMIAYVSRAEVYFERRKSPNASNGMTSGQGDRSGLPDLARLAQMARGVCARDSEGSVTRRLLVEIRTSPELIALSRDGGAPVMCQSGVLTPDHVTRTKNRYVYLGQWPEEETAQRTLVENAVRDYIAGYQDYYTKYAQDYPSPRGSSIPAHRFSSPRAWECWPWG